MVTFKRPAPGQEAVPPRHGADGRARAIIEAVSPEIDAGRFPVKRVPGDVVEVEADVFGDGHDAVAAWLLYKHEDESGWAHTRMLPLGNDRWSGSFTSARRGRYLYTVLGWVDHFDSWRNDLGKRAAAGQDLEAAFLVGAGLVDQAAERAPKDDGQRLREIASLLRAGPAEPLPAPDGSSSLSSRAAPGTADGRGAQQDAPVSSRGEAAATPGRLKSQVTTPTARPGPGPVPATPGPSAQATAEPDARLTLAQGDELAALMAAYPDHRFATRYERELAVEVDRERAAFSAWYEMFPRSASPQPGRPGTLRDVEARLPYVAGMGFDVLYLPPIHPIGETHRKGKNNSTTAQTGEPGSPWAIGSRDGGHKSVHPALGSLEDFRRLVTSARELQLEIALDIAFQCSPDHPYVREHPEWFKHRPDGSVQYAENPPKKYEDIYPFDFETTDWSELWQELRSIFLFWIEQGVHIFRVDNPHTKAFPFWEWAIPSIKAEHPDALFLAEAFTRPKLMYRLAKIGFSQSYTYFTWRNTRWELAEYLRELTSDPARQFFRPNFWPNTPDILTEPMQHGGRPAFMARLILAATMSSNYGIYGPAFELVEHTAREPGSEEYLNSEKYEVRHWAIDRHDSLRSVITRVNQARHECRALQRNEGVAFHWMENEQLICFSKRSAESEAALVLVNIDPRYVQSGMTNLDLDAIGLGPQQPFVAHDLLTGARYNWQGAYNYVELNPHVLPAHVFRIEPL